MIAPSLYADLRSRGVRLSIAETPEPPEPMKPLSLRVEAPTGALTEPLLAAIRRHKPELLQFVFELEERAAILEYWQDNPREVAEELARSCVHGGHASPDGELWLRDLAAHHPAAAAALKPFDAEAATIPCAGDGGQWQPPADFLERMEVTFT